jgi:hypothetical protein
MVPHSPSTTITLPLAERLRFDAYGKVSVPCSSDGDCSLPMKYAVLSHCPYGMACMEGGCAVVCPMWVHDPNPNVSRSYPVECDGDSGCDCAQWITVGALRCACHKGGCVEVTAVEPQDTNRI